MTPFETHFARMVWLTVKLEVEGGEIRQLLAGGELRGGERGGEDGWLGSA